MLLLIHGTWASAEGDEGHAWWQYGSSVWNKLQLGVPANVVLSEKGDVFHWSGNNTEWERHQAAERLYEQLKRYEAAGQPYHLIGHSHGGSVIWSTIKMAVRDKVSLDHLESWATVGTPFIHYRPATWWWFKPFILGPIITCVVVSILWLLVMLPLIAGMVEIERIIGNTPWLLLVFVPMIFLVNLVMANGRPFIFLSKKLFLATRQAILARREPQVSGSAVRLYGPRWLCIWSPDDEAIGGLRRTLKFHVSALAEVAPFSDRAYFNYKTPDQRKHDDEMASMHRFDMVTRLINRGVRSVNRWISASLAATLQGNNRPGTEVEFISAGPLGDSSLYLPLPRFINDAIVNAANCSAQSSVPQIRSALGQLLMGGEGSGMLSTPALPALSGRELVHTTYFDNDHVMHLLCLHVAKNCLRSTPSIPAFAVDAELLDWYESSGAALRQNVLKLTSQQRP